MTRFRPDRTLGQPAGKPLRFLVMVLLLWVSGRALMSTSILARGFNATASPAVNIPATKIEDKGRSTGAEPAKPAYASAKLTAPVEEAPILGSYYGRIRDIGIRSLDRVPITPARARSQGYAAMGESWNSSAPIFNMIPVPTAIPTAMTSSRASAAARVSVPIVSNDSVWGREEKAGQGGDAWSASAWAFWREGKGAGALGSAGQLGGAQAGARLDYVLARLMGRMPVSVYGRVSAALRKPAMPEAATGITIRPIGGPVPLNIGIERRFALDSNGRDAFALVATTGLYPTYVGPFIAEGYAQAGLVGFSRRDAFVDGRYSLVAPLDREERFRLGGSISGGAQPGVSRLDVGPVLEMRLPAGGISPRLLVEWRQRVAGRAAPGSGLSVTLASDF